MSLEEFKKIQEQRKEMKKEQERLAKVAFSQASTELFKKHPLLESFSWRQYTPYFNDGDTCYFSSHHEYCDITFKGDEEPREEGWIDNDEDNEVAMKAARDEISDVLGNFDDDDMEDLFGDHVEVTVTADGVEVDDCDHD